MFWWILFGAIWILLSLKTYYSLSLTDQIQFFFLIGALGLALIALTLQRKERRLDKELPLDRLSSFYKEYRKMHRKELKHFHIYWRWTIGAVAIGWTLFVCGQTFGKSLFTHPGAISLYFFFALLLGTKGVEKGREIDRKVVDLTLKGARIERKLSLRGEHYFSYFTKGKRMLAYLLRLLPLLLIVYPLFIFGLNPLLLSRFPSYYLLENLPMTLTVLALAHFVFAPYFELMKKYKKLVLQ